MRDLRKWLLLVWVALTVIVIDQITKALVVANIPAWESWMPLDAIRPYFTITHVQNTGAAFGLFQGGGDLFAVIALVVAALIVYFYFQLPGSIWPVRLALGLQLGGALGNWIDRVRLGYVVDFFDFKFWPVFNIADSAIVVGTLSLVVLMWWEDRRAARQQAEAEAAPGSVDGAEDEPSSITPS